MQVIKNGLETCPLLLYMNKYMNLETLPFLSSAILNSLILLALAKFLTVTMCQWDFSS